MTDKNDAPRARSRRNSGKATARLVRQTTAADCGHACISMLLDGLGIHIPLLALCARYPVGQRGMSAKEMMDLLRMCGARPRALRAQDGALEALRAVGGASIVHYRDEHFAVVAEVGERTVRVLDPAAGELQLSHDAFRARWSGVFICAEAAPDAEISGQRSVVLSLLGEFLRDNGGLWALVVAVALLLTASAVAIPWILSRTAMMAFSTGSGADALHVIAFATIAATMLFAYWLRSRAALMIQLRLERRLASRFLERLMRLPARVFAMLPTGDLLSRVNAVSGVRDFLSGKVATFVLDICVAGATIGIAWYLDAGIALVFLALTAAVSLVLLALWPHYRERVETEILAQAGYGAILAETLNGGIEIKVNRRESVFVDRMVDGLAQHQSRIDRRGRLAAVMDAIYAFQERVVPPIAVLSAMLAAPLASLEPIDLFFCYFLLSMAAPSIRSLQSFCMQTVMVRMNADRIESIQGLLDFSELETGAATTGPNHDGPLRVAVENLGFSYLGTGAPIIDGFSAEFDDSRMNVVIGASGGGKSTLLKLIGGLLVPDRGRIAIHLPGQPTRSAHAGAAAYLSQHPMVFSGTVTENICMFEPEPDPARIARCAQAACIHDEVMAWPLGYATPLVAAGRSISAGQAQRIALARLLYSAPAVMLLDEFTSDIDAGTERRMVENLRAWPGMKIVVTHRTSWVTAADRVIPLDARPAPERIDERQL